MLWAPKSVRRQYLSPLLLKPQTPDRAYLVECALCGFGLALVQYFLTVSPFLLSVMVMQLCGIVCGRMQTVFVFLRLPWLWEETLGFGLFNRVKTEKNEGDFPIVHIKWPCWI